MLLVKLDATSSTNDYLKKCLVENPQLTERVIIAHRQTQGRGQGSNIWQSEDGKNLTISFLKRFLSLKPMDAFLINQAVSVSLAQVLIKYNLPQIKVKWPNDIMSGDKKLAGILVENQISGSQLHSSIIGIGLNVNQENFENLENATSMFLRKNVTYNLEDVLHKLLDALDKNWSLIANQRPELERQYQQLIFRRGDWCYFYDQESNRLEAKILGVDKLGRLVLQNRQGSSHTIVARELKMII